MNSSPCPSSRTPTSFYPKISHFCKMTKFLIFWNLMLKMKIWHNLELKMLSNPIWRSKIRNSNLVCSLPRHQFSKKMLGDPPKFLKKEGDKHLLRKTVQILQILTWKMPRYRLPWCQKSKIWNQRTSFSATLRVIWKILSTIDPQHIISF